MRGEALIYLLAGCAGFWLFHAPCAYAAGEEDGTSCHEFAGLADSYHHKLYGQKTASGQILKQEVLTAAHRLLPFGTRVKVTNKHTGHSCVVVINDRGPFTSGRVIDLSRAAARAIDLGDTGSVLVACKVIDEEDGQE